MNAGREIVLVRHGETEWSRSGLHTGRTDIALTELGRRQADQLAAKLEGRAFVLAMTSPLQRARETCERADLGCSAELSDDLLEWDYGDYEGITTADIRRGRPDWFLWRDGAPGGESPDDVAARCDRVIARVLEAIGDGEDDVAVVAHGHLLRVFAARWLEQPPAFGCRLWLATGSLSVLGFERETQVIRRWNA